MRSFWGGSRPAVSPLSMSHDGVPDVTDGDFEYVTSDHIRNRVSANDGPLQFAPTGSRSGGSYFRAPNDGDLDDIPQEDVLLLRNGIRTDTEYFPAFSIGDGKLRTFDIRDRVQLLYKLSDVQTERVKLYYKGKLLKPEDEPVCKHGVKNNSEILVVLDGGSQGRSARLGPESFANGGRQARSPPLRPLSGPSSSVGNLEVPPRGRRDVQSGASSVSRAASVGSGVSGISGISSISTITPPTAIGSPMEKLKSIAVHFDTKLLPLCEEYISKTPSNKKQREDEHRKLSEILMQHVLLKLDGVDAGGNEATRARRKELVTRVQEILKALDATLKAWQR